MDIAEKSFKIEKFIKDTVDNVCKVLDEKMIFASTHVGKLSDKDLMLLSLELPGIIYNVCQQMEVIGGKADTAKIVAENKYNQKFITLDSGTVDQKKAVASQESAEMELYVVGYQRAYKTIQARVQAAYEFVNSAKKILSVHEMERNNIQNGNVSQ